MNRFFFLLINRNCFHFLLDDLMLAACRNDQDEMLEDIFKEGDFDINHTDALGDSALHYAYGNMKNIFA